MKEFDSTEQDIDNKILSLLSRLENKIEVLENKIGIDPQDKWGSAKEAMNILKISSKTTLHKLKSSGAFRYAKLSSKMELYYLPSVYEYLESKSNI